MNSSQRRVMDFGRMTLKVYLFVSAFMFVGGLIAGAALALAGYTLPNPF